MVESSGMPIVPRLLRDMSAVGLVAVDKRMNVVLWNRFMEMHSHLSAAEVEGRNLFDCFPELPQAWLEKKLKTIMLLKNTAYSSWQQRPYLFKFPNVSSVTSEAEQMFQDGSFWALRDESGQVQGACISIHDVTEFAIAQQLLEEAAEQTLNLEEISYRDALTGLYNRRFFDEQIRHEMQRARHFGWDFSLAMVDIDFFKKVNDTYGHDAGDEVLKGVALTLLKELRASDTLCRFGGEEFVMLLPKVNRDNVQEIADRLLDSVRAAQVDAQEATISVTISLGISQYREGVNGEQLLKEADKALYISKTGGRDRFTLFDPDDAAFQ